MGNATLDPKGIVVTCPQCGQRNRIGYTDLTHVIRCGRCKSEISGVAEAVPMFDEIGFNSLIQLSSLPVLVDFWAPWCGPCKMMAPEFEKAALALKDKLILAKLNTEEVPEVAQQYQVSSIPALILFFEGKELARTAGARPAASIQQWAEQSASCTRA